MGILFKFASALFQFASVWLLVRLSVFSYVCWPYRFPFCHMNIRVCVFSWVLFLVYLLEFFIYSSYSALLYVVPLFSPSLSLSFFPLSFVSSGLVLLHADAWMKAEWCFPTGAGWLPVPASISLRKPQTLLAAAPGGWKSRAPFPSFHLLHLSGPRCLHFLGPLEDPPSLGDSEQQKFVFTQSGGQRSEIHTLAGLFFSGGS